MTGSSVTGPIWYANRHAPPEGIGDAVGLHFHFSQSLHVAENTYAASSTDSTEEIFGLMRSKNNLLGLINSSPNQGASWVARDLQSFVKQKSPNEAT
jgi:hypothetical protein